MNGCVRSRVWISHRDRIISSIHATWRIHSFGHTMSLTCVYQCVYSLLVYLENECVYAIHVCAEFECVCSFHVYSEILCVYALHVHLENECVYALHVCVEIECVWIHMKWICVYMKWIHTLHVSIEHTLNVCRHQYTHWMRVLNVCITWLIDTHDMARSFSRQLHVELAFIGVMTGIRRMTLCNSTCN